MTKEQEVVVQDLTVQIEDRPPDCCILHPDSWREFGRLIKVAISQLETVQGADALNLANDLARMARKSGMLDVPEDATLVYVNFSRPSEN